MQFLVIDEAGLCALSPNRSLFAIVKKGLIVLFMDYIRRTNELMKCGEAGGVSSSHGAATPSSPQSQVDAVIFKHTALDEIHELQWSPDSTLMSLLLARRRIVEIVSVHGKCCVARIDAGIAGLRAVRWHPSSRVVYWVGLLQAHVLSLVDGQVMRLTGSVKYSAQLASRFSTSKSRLHGDTSYSSSSTNHNTATIAADGIGKLGYPVSEAALLRFSTCRRFLLYITPRTLESPLSTSVGRQKSNTHVSGGVTAGAPETVVQPPLALSSSSLPTPDCKAGDGVRPRRSEWLVAASATTHEELHAFSTGHLVPSVSDFIPLQGGVALVDYIHGSLVVTTYNGAHVLHRESSGVQNVVSSKSGDVLFIVFASACRTVLVNMKRVVALRCISFEADVILPLQLQKISILEEPPSVEHSLTSLSCLGEPYRRATDGVAHLLMGADQVIRGIGVETSSIGQAAISASGRIAAVKLGMWPSTVLVVDTFRQLVVAVLHHREVVTGLFWSPSPHSEFWRFQQRHYIQRGGEKACGGPTGSDATTGGSFECEEPLLVTTDNNEAKVFLWLATYAVCYAASGVCDHSTAVVNLGHTGKRCMCPHGGYPSPLRISCAMFGDDAADAVLIDDTRGIALTVAFHDVCSSKPKMW